MPVSVSDKGSEDTLGDPAVQSHKMIPWNPKQLFINGCLGFQVNIILEIREFLASDFCRQSGQQISKICCYGNLK